MYYCYKLPNTHTVFVYFLGILYHTTTDAFIPQFNMIILDKKIVIGSRSDY